METALKRVAFVRAALARALFIVCGVSHAATTPDPGDYTALPAGTHLSLLYAQDIRADNVYAHGVRVTLPRDLDLRMRVGVLRQVYYSELGGYRVNSQVVVPVARQSDALNGRNVSGVGNVVFGGSLWSIADAVNGEHLAYSLFLSTPTGSNRDQYFAARENRWAADLQVGYIKRLTPEWAVDLLGQTEFYQKERDTGADRDPLLRLFLHLRYRLSETSHIATSLRYSAGARETAGAMLLVGRKNDANLALTWARFFTRHVQLQAQFSHDLRVDNGPRLNAVTLRVLYTY